ncbi:MAG TPA: 2-dehydropantoate 2-reductase, partial [Spirochaetia bacterium]|nr:2-dehydropantoate 2-reductase [Spirochaetia bacterium]
GAGAVGAAVAALIADKAPGAVSVLAGGERARRYRQDGFLLNGARRDFPLVAPEDTSEPDLVVVAVKTYQLDQLITDLRRHVGPATLILSLLNGISSEEALARAFGAEKVPLAMILGIDAVREGHATRFSGRGRIHFGDPENVEGAWSERVTRIASFFQEAGVPFAVPADMVRSLWFKFMINVGINQASAVLRATYGRFQVDGDAKDLMESAMRETVALSRALGTGLEESDVAEWGRTLSKLAPEGKTSMLQDVEAGRRTEVDAFAGTVMALAEPRGLSVPVNRTLFRLIRAAERGYRVAD